MMMNRLKAAGFLAAALFYTANVSAELSDGLVSLWPLDGNFQDAIGQNDGIFMGTDDPNFEAGKFGQGIALDGIDQFIEISGDESQFDFANGESFSISAWFRVDAFTKDWQALIAKGEGNRWRVHRRGGGDTITWNGGNADVPEYFADDFDLEPADDGDIHHFLGISTPDEVLQYIDGQLVSIGPAPSVENNAMPVMIGENPDARGRTWEGLVDDVAIWGRALTEDEVSTIWNNGEGTAIPVPEVIPPLFVEGRDTIGTRTFTGERSNPVFGPETAGAPGWSGRMVTIDDHGLTLDSQTTAEEALADNEGTRRVEAYDVVDLAGGGGTFPVDHPYPNGVNDASQDDFAVEVKANLTIPAGEWTIGFGSDDGGSVRIEGIEISDFNENDAFEDGEIRREAPRGHGWTVGSFSLDAPLETSIVASFYERGGGDSFEIAITEGEVIEAANPNDWVLLGDGALGWEVKSADPVAPLVSADLTATVQASREMEFDVNGDTGASDLLSLPNPNSSIFTTILDIDGLTFQIKSTGDVSSGEAFTIIEADQIVGTPTIISATEGQNWVFDAATGRVCLDSCPTVDFDGDFDGNGSLDVADLNILAAELGGNNLRFDVNGDGAVNTDDYSSWVVDVKGTWIGDANLDGEFNSSDFVEVFTAGLFETNQPAGWSQGDWNGDGVFGSGDFVAAFTDGGFELGPRPAAAVPEPGTGILALVILPLIGFIRKRK